MTGLWLVHLDKNGMTGCGSERNIPCYSSRRSAQAEIARSMIDWNNGGEVYLIPGAAWTQKMCEMDALSMGAHVRQIGTRLM